MREIRVPSAVVPGPPRLALTVSDAWEVLPAPGVLLAVAEPASGHRFRSNLVITARRMPASTVTLEALHRQLAQQRAGLPDAEDFGSGSLEIEGRIWAAAEYAYTQPQRGTVLQASRSTLVAHAEGQLVDVVDVVGSCSAEQGDEGIELIRRMQDSVRIMDGPASTGD